MAVGMVAVGGLCPLLDAGISPRAAPRAVFAFMGLLVLFIKYETGLIPSLTSLPIC